MGLWAFYFFSKLYLYFRGYIYLDFIPNFLFAIFISIPVPRWLKFREAIIRSRAFLAVILGILLFWHDSWLPPMADILNFARGGGLPTPEFIYQFFLGFFDLGEALALGVILIFCLMVRNHMSLTPWVIGLLLFVPIKNFGQGEGEMDRNLNFFYESQGRIEFSFDRSNLPGHDFDLVVLHVCSLSWEDLQAIGMERDPFFERFDYLFTNFNSVTTYSNPSVIRLLRAKCGQQRHDALYQDAPAGCYLFEGLRAAGYETFFTFNHDGEYANFFPEMMRWGRLGPPILPTELPIQQYNFDGSVIFDDYAVLEKWWNIRKHLNAPKAALYYNTVSLHDGAHWVGDDQWWKRDRAQKYQEFVAKLFHDLSRFFDLMARSGRKVVVLFVAEHGMALTGSGIQARGLRDIPLPGLTIVPAGVILIGLDQNATAQYTQVISKPTSYHSLSYLISSFFKIDPFSAGRSVRREMSHQIPEVNFVSDNGKRRVIQKGEDYFLEIGSLDKRWVKLSPDIRPNPVPWSN